jgi:hypothetical protein
MPMHLAAAGRSAVPHGCTAMRGNGECIDCGVSWKPGGLSALVICLVTLAPACAPAPLRPLLDADITDLVPDLAPSGAYLNSMRTCGDPMVTARWTISGFAAGRRVHTRLWVAASGGGALIRIESADSRPLPSFILTGGGSSSDPVATLRLPRERLVVEAAPAAELIAATLGAPLTGAEVAGMLSGCPQPYGSLEGRRLGEHSMRVVVAQRVGDLNILHLERPDAQSPWHVRAMTSTRPESPLRTRTEFWGPPGRVPQKLRLAGLQWNGTVSRDLDLEIVVDHVHANVILDMKVLAQPLQASDSRITLQELRARRGGLPLIVN